MNPKIKAEVAWRKPAVEQAIQWYKNRPGRQALEAVLVSSDTENAKLGQLNGIALKLNEAISPLVACANKCSHCCYQAVEISTEEARLITQFTGVEFEDVDSDISEDVVSRYKGVKCSFLNNGRCTIYAVRPLACKLSFNLSGTSSLCDTKTPAEVPTVDLADFWITTVGALKESRFNDIRMFFPTDVESK